VAHNYKRRTDLNAFFPGDQVIGPDGFVHQVVDAPWVENDAVWMTIVDRFNQLHLVQREEVKPL
jgi:hypothetical protein